MASIASRTLTLLLVAAATPPVVDGNFFADAVTVEGVVTCDSAAPTCSEDTTTTSSAAWQQDLSNDTATEADAVWADHYRAFVRDEENVTEILLRFYGCPHFSDEFGIDGSSKRRPYSEIPTEETYSLFDEAYYHAVFGSKPPPRNEELIRAEREQQPRRDDDDDDHRKHHLRQPSRGMKVPYEVRWDPKIGRTLHATTFIPANTMLWDASSTASFPRDNAPAEALKLRVGNKQSNLDKVLPEETIELNMAFDDVQKKKNEKDDAAGTYEYWIDSDMVRKLEELLAQGKFTDLIDKAVDLTDPATKAIMDASTFTSYRAFIEYLHDRSDPSHDWACDALMWTYSSIDDIDDNHVCVNFDAGAIFNDSRDDPALETATGRECDDEFFGIEPFEVEEGYPKKASSGKVGCLCFAFFASRDIQPGEEFRYNYEYFGESAEDDDELEIVGDADDEDDEDDDEYETVYVDEAGNIIDINDGLPYRVLAHEESW
eukprot:CAMPEP_0197174174 /NCGR_PEP_ID=MMETSP1423-20130617/811_1 /TAXON_ID=476441 /ORGANISM="Pseudo-nitzschia heimii, Strain UNC1101" /LENGTH=487 /DNA_ID=CAMNT_0042623075 /DNA_START=104 /DNA_END=1567 /DNA_ORIENTATION=+